MGHEGLYIKMHLWHAIGEVMRKTRPHHSFPCSKNDNAVVTEIVLSIAMIG